MHETDTPPPRPLDSRPARPGRPVLSVVIPMYQEARRIEATLRDAVATGESWGFETEILPVDDGSTDGTWDLVTSLARELAAPGSRCTIRPLRHDRNRGKGAGVRTGLAAARGDWVLMMDADNSARLAELPRLAEAGERTGAALAVGSRAAPDAEVAADPKRKATGLVFRAALASLGMGFVRDTQCGFKLYRRDAANLCVRHGVEDGFAFDLEHLGLCRAAGLGVAEVGIRWEHRTGGTIHILKDGLKMLGEAVRIRRRLRRLARVRPAAQVEVKPLPMASQPTHRPEPALAEGVRT